MQNAIVTAADSKYLPAACCALLSCVRDGKAESQASFFLLACGVNARDVEDARSFLKNQGASVEIVAIGADRLKPFRIDSYVSAATYSRLVLPEIFDDRWGRLLYLDADTRAMVGVQTLLNANLNGKPIGAVHDYLQYFCYGIGDSRTRLALRSDAPYFNAGVICFDWRVTMASGLMQRAQAFALESAHLCSSHDQDALNKAFEGAWAPLDPRWNLMTVAIPENVLRLDYPERLHPYISHFAGSVKPWMANFPGRFEHHRAWYRNLLRDSPWPQFAAPANAALGEAPGTSSADRLKGWILARRGSLQAAFERLSPAGATAAQLPQDATARKSRSAEASDVELEHLLDLMVAEAAGSDLRDAY